MKPVTLRSRSMDPAGRCAAWHISHIIKAFHAKTAQIPYACGPRPHAHISLDASTSHVPGGTHMCGLLPVSLSRCRLPRSGG